MLKTFRTPPAEVAVNTDHAFMDLVVGNYKKETHYSIFGGIILSITAIIALSPAKYDDSEVRFVFLLHKFCLLATIYVDVSNSRSA